MRDLMQIGHAPDLSHLHGRLNRIFGDFWTDGVVPSNGKGHLVPAADVYETPEEFVVTMEVAGIDPGAVEISTVAGELTIAGERKPAELPENSKRFLGERTFGTFRRTFAIPRTIDLENVSARVTHGVLTVRLPKRPEILPTKIQVEVD